MRKSQPKILDLRFDMKLIEKLLIIPAIGIAVVVLLGTALIYISSNKEDNKQE